MLVGHYSTALLAHQKCPKGSLLYFLIASQLQDLLWFIFHYLGLETTTPNDIFGATLGNMRVDMIYSHDLLPQIFWIAVVFLIGKLWFKSTNVGLIGAALVVGHFVLDFFSGHPHHLFGADSIDVGLGLYASNIYLAIGIEVVFVGMAIWYFLREESKKGFRRSTKNKAILIGFFSFGLGFMLLIATTSFREWLNIPEINSTVNTNVPTLVIMYVGMIIFLNYFVRKPE